MLFNECLLTCHSAVTNRMQTALIKKPREQGRSSQAMPKGWDAFLTEQDKAHQAVVGKKGPAGFGENPCVLVIDDYYSVLGLERQPILESIKTWPMSCGLEGWEAIDKT